MPFRETKPPQENPPLTSHQQPEQPYPSTINEVIASLAEERAASYYRVIESFNPRQEQLPQKDFSQSLYPPPSLETEPSHRTERSDAPTHGYSSEELKQNLVDSWNEHTARSIRDAGGLLKQEVKSLRVALKEHYPGATLDRNEDYSSHYNRITHLQNSILAHARKAETREQRNASLRATHAQFGRGQPRERWS